VGGVCSEVELLVLFAIGFVDRRSSVWGRLVVVSDKGVSLNSSRSSSSCVRANDLRGEDFLLVVSGGLGLLEVRVCEWHLVYCVFSTGVPVGNVARRR
jgi:hypothetical protein